MAAGCAVLLTHHDEGVDCLEQRLAGVQEAFESAGVEVTFVRAPATGVEPDAAAAAIAQALAAHAGADGLPPIAAIISSGQSDLQGALRLKQRGGVGAGVQLFGYDLNAEILKAVEAGDVAATVDQQPYLQGFMPVVQLALYVRYGIEPCDMDAGANLVHGGNVAAVAKHVQSGHR